VHPSFTEEEISKSKELKKFGFFERLRPLEPTLGSYLFGRNCPKGCIPVQESIFLIVERDESQNNLLWMPQFDELLEMARKLGVSFSLITDFLHRRRFADGKEREGVYQLFLERFRSLK
jgi:hypothetical protein